MNVVVDIEAIGRGYKSVFAVAFCVSYRQRVETRVFYMTPIEASEGTMDWWQGDSNRKAFLEMAMERARNLKISEVVAEMRVYINTLYNKVSVDEDIIFYSDFPEFDIGMTSALLGEYGYNPLYLKDDRSAPAMCVNYNTLLRGITRTSLKNPTKQAYMSAGIVRPQRSQTHDPEYDVRIIMQEVEKVLTLLS